MTQQSYDQFAEAFASRYYLTRALDGEMDAFREHLPQDSLILDAGCGPGHQARYFISTGARSVGLDLSHLMLQQGHFRDPSLLLIQGDLLAEPFADQTFDGIWARASLIHLNSEDHRIALKEFYRILKPGGRLYAAVRQGRGEEIRRETQCGVPLTRYFRFWNPTEWHDLLRLTGFRLLLHGIEAGKPEDWLWVHALKDET